MTKVSEENIERMKNNGLFVAGPVRSVEKGQPYGLHITKPTEDELVDYLKAGVDIIPGRTFLRLWFVDDKWIVECREFVPKPGPGDFSVSFETEEEAVDDVLRFFSGDERWQFKQDLYKRKEN